MQSTVPAQALALCWCQSLAACPRGMVVLPLPHRQSPEKPCQLGSVILHRHVSININMNCMNWGCFERCIICIFLLD